MGRFWEVQLEIISQLENDWKVFRVNGREGAPLRIEGYVRGGYSEIERGMVSVRGKAKRRIEVEE